MPLHSLDIQKTYLTEVWTNRYILDVADLAAAATPAAAIVAAERSVHVTGVNFDRYRVSTVAEGDDSYVITPIGLPGLYSGAGDLLPLFNVIRVDFNTGSGRPSRKYLRGCLGEGDTAGGNLSVDLSALIAANYLDDVLAVSAFVDVDGQPFVSGAVYNSIHMRQLRRGSRRRTTPVI